MIELTAVAMAPFRQAVSLPPFPTWGAASTASTWGSACQPGLAVKDPWQNYKQAGCVGEQLVPAKPVVVPRAYVADRDRRYYNFQDKELEKIDWNGDTIVPVQKEFLHEHPLTAARSQEECNLIRLRHSINIVHDGGEEVPKPMENFEEAPFPDWLCESLRQRGFTQPTAIQLQAWPVALHGHDLVGIAETGSGKTMAYIPPMLVHILAQPELRPGEGPVALVIAPTRELCIQVCQETEFFTNNGPAEMNLHCYALTGGSDSEEQATALLGKYDVLACTPGRLLDFLQKKKTNLRRATFVVLDEADELLTSGFEFQLRMLMSQIRPDRQVCLFSATWPSKIEKLVAEVCSCRPIHINVGSIKLAACQAIQQSFKLIGDCPDKCEFPGASKLDVLQTMLKKATSLMQRGQKGLVFCNKGDMATRLVDELQSKGWHCAGLTGALEQHEREATIRMFRDDDSDLYFLVCTALLGRGHDFPNVRFVINYDMPPRIVEYVHRIGRTGRAGQRGFAVTLVELSDLWIASDLSQCLRESKQRVPQWLIEAKSKKKREAFRKWHRYGGPAPPALVNWGMPPPPASGGGHGAVAAIADGSVDDVCAARVEWTGRGSGKRHIFLQGCHGMGPARIPRS